MKPGYKEIGRVRQLCRYVVKGMAGESLDQVKVGWNGLLGDRRYALQRIGNRSGLPFASARELPALTLYTASFRNPLDVDRGGVSITTPTGEVFDLYDPAWLPELEAGRGEKLDVISLWRGAFDSMPVSLISDRSVHSIEELVGQQLEVARFRPNIVVEALEPKAFPEDRWVGELLVFGDDSEAARIRANRKDLRCGVVDVNPATGKKDCDILANVVRTRKNFLGIYGTTERPGLVRLGDTVYTVDR